MNAVFNGPSKMTSSATGRIEGYGGGGDSSLGSPTSEPFGAASTRHSATHNHGYGEGTFSAGASSTGGSKMVGFGNPQYDNSKGRSSPTFIEKMKAKMNGTDGSVGAQTGPYKTYDRSAATFQPPPIASIDATRRRGEVGGVWANDDGSNASVSFSTSNISQSPASGGAYTAHVPKPVRPTSSNGEYETRLVDSLTPPVGVRTQPTKEELNKFSQQCESLDKLLVVKIINENKLPADQHANTQMKALCLIESILTTGDARSTEEVEDYLCENATNLEWLETNGANVPLRNKSVRIMELCGLREEKKPVPSPAAANVSASSSAYYSGQQQQQHQQQAKPAAAPEVDLLGFASPPPQPAATNTASESAFGFLEPSAGASAPAAASTSPDNLFGSMEIRAPQQQQQQTAQSNPPSSNGGDMFDLFGSSTSNTTSQAPSQSASSPNSLDFLNSSAPSTSTSSGKVDPLTALMSNAKISSIPPQQRQPMPMQPAASIPFGANGMAGFPPRQNMPPLGPTGPYPGQFGGQYPPQQGYPPYGAPQGYPPQQGGMYPQQYPPQQYPPQQGGYPYGAPIGGPSASNTNALFQVKAAGSSAPSVGLRPTIDLDPLGNPILLGPTGSPSASNSTGSNSSGSAFGFVATGGDQFEFVNDMMKK